MHYNSHRSREFLELCDSLSSLFSLKEKVNLQRQIAKLLASSNVDRFPEIPKQTAQSAAMQGKSVSKGVPTLLGREDQNVRVVAALLAEYQSGTGFNLATDVIKVINKSIISETFVTNNLKILSSVF